MTKKVVTSDGEIIDANEPGETTNALLAIDTPPFFKTPWNHNRDAESNRTGLRCEDPSRTQQQFAKDADINVILAKFLANGELSLTGQPKYGDYDQEFDLQNEMVTASQVQEAWDALPIAARNILKDPKVFADYVEHCLETGDISPLRELGLAKPLNPPLTPTPEGENAPPGA